MEIGRREISENLLRRIKRQLDAKFYVMNDAWLKDCIEFFIRDKVSHQMTDEHILEFVESQWQLSDLREISNTKGCLPRNLVQQIHTVLTDTYILQVDKMYDIASAKYKQLCEIRKIDNENSKVKVEEESMEWQPKGRRMMQLCLTDGVQDIIAIEYTPLKQITGTLLPGYKVMIIGPIDCRRGIVLLEDSKYKEVGGEVETLLKSNALENVLARALDEPENPDPYNDNGSSRSNALENVLARALDEPENSDPYNDNGSSTSIITNQNAQSIASNNNDSFFDDDFEEAIDLESVTVIERQSQETVQRHFESTYDCGQVAKKETNEIMEEVLEDIDFEPLQDWPIDPSIRPSQGLPSQTDTKKIKEDIKIVEQASTSTRDFRSQSPLLTSSIKNQNFSEFPDEEKSMVNTSGVIQQVPKPKIIPNPFESRSAPKICDILSDVLHEPIMGIIYKTVRGQVKNHSALTKQGKCWSVTALITDHTSSVEVCFDSKILEDFLGFSVQEFVQKKKLAKLDPQVNNELRLRLRKAQHEIQNLDALLKLELALGKMPKIVGITQLTAQQKEDFVKRPI